MNIVNTSALEDDDTSFLDGRRGSVRLATHPVGEEVHRVDGRQLDLQTLLLAKQEFQDHMRSILLRGVKEGLVSQHETAMSQSPSYAAEIDTYQRVLRQTKLWNQDIISRETNRVLGDNKNLFPNLLAALYISQVKLMASVRVTKGPCTVQINVPSSESFLHRVYIECARILFQNPLLIYVGKNMSPSKLCERNVNLDRVVADGITEAVRYMLPVKDIMSEYLNSTMLQSSVLSMGDDFEAYMKSPYESRFVEHTPTIPSVDPFHPSMYQSLPVVSQFNPPPPLPPPPPPPAPAPPPPPPTTLPSIPGMPSWNPASGFDDPDTKVVSRDDYTKFDARAPNPLVSRFEDRNPVYSAAAAAVAGVVGFYAWTKYTESGKEFLASRDQLELCKLYVQGAVALAVIGYFASSHFGGGYSGPSPVLLREDFSGPDQTMLTEPYD